MLSLIAKTNHEPMINTIQVRLNDGTKIRLDRKTTYYSFDEALGVLDMDWYEIYIHQINDEYQDGAKGIDELSFEGAVLLEVEVEDDADEDYFVTPMELLINDTSIKLHNFKEVL